MAVALRTIRLIVNPAPYLDRCGFCNGGIIAPVGIGSFIFLTNFYFSILFIVLLQFAGLIVGWDLNVWVLWDN